MVVHGKSPFIPSVDGVPPLWGEPADGKDDGDSCDDDDGDRGKDKTQKQQHVGGQKGARHSTDMAAEHGPVMGGSTTEASLAGGAQRRGIRIWPRLQDVVDQNSRAEVLEQTLLDSLADLRRRAAVLEALVQTVEKMVEVPQAQTVEKIVEVPQAETVEDKGFVKMIATKWIVAKKFGFLEDTEGRQFFVHIKDLKKRP